MGLGRDKLNRIRVEGFLSLRDVDLELNAVTLLVGANGAGKSNLLTVFDLLREIVQGGLQTAVAQAGGPDRLLHQGARVTRRIVFDLTFSGDRPNSQSRYRAELVLALDRLVFESETWWAWHHPEHPRPIQLISQGSHDESALVESVHGLRMGEWVRNALTSWRRFHFHDTSQTAAVKQACEINDNGDLRRDGANLAAVLYRFSTREPATYRRIVAAVQAVAPFFEDFALRPAAENPRLIRLEWNERGTDMYRDGHSLSDGTLRFVCLATLLLQPDPPKMIVIDEPELGLHPAAIVQLADLVRAATATSQVLLATQSVTLLNQFETQDVVVVEQRDGASVFERLSAERIQDWVEDYALGEIWEKNLIGGRPA